MLVLSDEESCLLRAAADGAVAVTDGTRDCARALKRLGYLTRLSEGYYAITEHGRRRLVELTGAACALSQAAYRGEAMSLTSS
jgi:hypothetical protein